jgi:hypothetical protein
MTTWVSVAAELLHDHLGPYKEPVQSVFNEHLFGYEAGDPSGREASGLTVTRLPAVQGSEVCTP